MHKALKEKTNTLIEAPTGLGKTHKVATTGWSKLGDVTDEKPVIHVSPTIKTRDRAFQLSEEAEGVIPHRLRGREEACPVAKGDYDHRINVPGENCPPSAWFNRKCDAEKIPFSEAHKELEQRCGALPCSENERCEAVSQWHTIFESDSVPFDVLHVTQSFIFNTALTKGANLIFDEQPDYTIEVKKEVEQESQIRRVTTQEKIRQAVTDVLSQIPGSHNTWESLLTAVQADDTATIDQFRSQLTNIELDPDWVFTRDDVHALAPAIIQALLNSTDVGNGRKRGIGWYNPSKFGFGTEEDTEVIVIFDTKNNIKLIHYVPDLSETRCVIGLDGHPTLDLWKLQTTPTLQLERVADAIDKFVWRRDERKLTVYQVDEYTRSYTTGWAGRDHTERERTRRRAMALIKAMTRKFGDDFRTCITSKSLKSDVERMMKEAGVTNPTVLHYGGIKSRDDFKTEPVGLLIGCIDPGDENILDKVALLGLSAQAEMTEKEDGSVVRATGRFFEGEDADVAEEILQSIRERNVGQAIGRYARDNHNPDRESAGAIVYVWTDAIPNGMVDDAVRGVRKIPINKEKRIAEMLEMTDRQMTIREIVAEFESNGETVSKTHVQNILDNLVEQGKAEKESGGKYGAYLYSVHDGVLDSLTVVDLEP
ncbi:hypothetical protein [Haloarcula marina]|uniref:hypothetical protein n=1 Tax=Haloarcula marina TaxID=2961574 RepID=UPI0020B7AE30|nr:hypothetical protein [Halomicroarcula marina]